MEVKVINLEEIKVAVLEHIGPPNEVEKSVAKFRQWRKSSQDSPAQTARTFGIAYSDPTTTPVDKFRFDICGELKNELTQNSFGIIPKSIPAGKYAVLRHLGTLQNIHESIYYIFQTWLPKSGEKQKEFPLFFQYINVLPEVSQQDQVTDIFVSLH